MSYRIWSFLNATSIEVAAAVSLLENKWKFLFPHCKSDTINIKISVITTIQQEQSKQDFQTRLPCNSFPTPVFTATPFLSTQDTRCAETALPLLVAKNSSELPLPQISVFPASQEFSLQFSTEFFKRLLGYKNEVLLTSLYQVNKYSLTLHYKCYRCP